MNPLWEDAIKMEFIYLQSSQTVEEAKHKLIDRKAYALIMNGDQPLSLITAESLADLPLTNTLSQHVSGLPPLVTVYDNPNLSTASLAHYIQTILLGYINLPGVVVMDQAGLKIKGILRRRDIVKWITSGMSDSRGASDATQTTYPDIPLTELPNLSLVQYICPECSYCQYLLCPPQHITIFCPHHPNVKLILRKDGHAELSSNQNSMENISNLRLDTAVPEQVTLGRSFDLAVAVRQPSSPQLSETDLPVVSSQDMPVYWPESAPYVQLRLQIKAPECIIHGDDSYTFRLLPEQNSPKFYFHLIPQHVGKVSIIVTVYQQNDWLGGARVYTLVHEQVTGKVKINIFSTHPLEQTTNDETEFLRDLLDRHVSNLKKLKIQKTVYGNGEAPLRLLNEIENQELAIGTIQKQLEELETEE